MSFYQQFSEDELEILRARAERVAHISQEDRGKTTLNALLVSIRQETYALPITAISNVYQGIPVIPVPCVPSHIAGVANVRGHILPVLDLAVLLGVPGEPAEEAANLIVANKGQMQVAFAVERIGEVVALPMDKLNPVPATIGLERAAYLEGVFTDGVALLDVEAVLSDPALMVDEIVV